jgi:hypothetical protein
MPRGIIGLSPLKSNGSHDSQVGRLDGVSGVQKRQFKGGYQA